MRASRAIVLLMACCTGLFAGAATMTFEDMEKRCNKGVAAWCLDLGWSYRDGKGVEQDYFKASAYFKKACDGRNDAVANALGCGALGVTYLDIAQLYRDGLGVGQNDHQATFITTRRVMSATPVAASCLE
ncbi:hypothetical protein FACS1894103_6580 [Campylobacterota bacterium]|nr:hypothetical protein FACS1894103_6580 [Campylobacterota bacterium]